MKWFKHDTNTFSNPKIEMLKEKHGVAGYGVYFQLVELIASAVDKENVDDWGYLPDVYSMEYLAKKFCVDIKLLEEILQTCISLKLVEKRKDRIFCPKVLDRCDEFIEKVKRSMSGEKKESNGSKSSSNPDSIPTDSGTRTKKEEQEVEEETEKEININTGKSPEIKKSLNSVGAILQDRYKFSQPASNGITKQWQDKAFRYADMLHISLTDQLKPRWLKVFKQADLGRKTSNLEQAYSYLIDYPNTLTNEEKVKYFFYIYENGLQKDFNIKRL
ncbi:DUF4373 domain-containing protein [Patescibacteria group bacterium]|nr:DUF4373 domain-containing protein [Patescibacteria group bacterium]